MSGNWQQIGQDINGENFIDQSGYSVSLSSDGTTLAVGERLNNEFRTDAGRVRIYQNVGGNWQQVGQNITGEDNDDQSGFSVSLSADGSRVAIGAPYNDGNGSNSGHVRVYENNAGTWQQLGIDIDGDDANDNAGFSVSLSADGNTVAFGTPYGASTNRGEVAVYQYNGTSWQQIGQDIDAANFDREFGISVSLSNDGNTLAVGSSFDIYANPNTGRIRVYENNAGTWQQIGADITNTIIGIQYSQLPVSLSGDASTLAVGFPLDDFIYYDEQGNSYAKIYRNNSGTWQQLDQTINEENAQDGFGSSVSISDDGSTVAIGARYNNTKGHTRVFFNSNTLSLQEVFQTTYSISPNPNNGIATINLETQLQEVEVQIFDMLGKQLSTTKHHNIHQIHLDVSQQPQGLYVVKLLFDGKIVTSKLIKQ
jgi:hypothetical protein